MANLQVLHTTDLHGRLTPREAERLRQLREQHQALLLDSGDAVTAGNLFVWPWAEGVLPLMNQAGYQAMALGNREYFFRHRGLRHKTHGAEFPIISTNLRTRRGQPALQHCAALPTAGGDRVGLIGLTPEMIPPGAWGERFSDMRFVPWRQAAREAVEHLRPEVDWLVALSHLPPADSHELADLCPELDLILAGHGHPDRMQVEQVGRVTLVHTPPQLREVVLARSRGETSPSEFTVEVIAL